MNLFLAPEERFLERSGARVPLTAGEAALFLRLTPMGRKIRFRRRALELAGVPGEERKARLLMEWSGLPAKEWRTPP